MQVDNRWIKYQIIKHLTDYLTNYNNLTLLNSQEIKKNTDSLSCYLLLIEVFPSRIVKRSDSPSMFPACGAKDRDNIPVPLMQFKLKVLFFLCAHLDSRKLLPLFSTPFEQDYYRCFHLYHCFALGRRNMRMIKINQIEPKLRLQYYKNQRSHRIPLKCLQQFQSFLSCKALILTSFH